MRKIEIDEEVYQALLKHVKSFEDTPNAVLRRLLGLDELNQDQQDTERLIREDKDYERPVKEMMSSLGLKDPSISNITRVRGAIPQKEYRIPILEALLEKGGKASQREVFEIIEQKMEKNFNHLDLETLSDGYTKRWQKMAAWQRYIMVKEGLLRSDSPRGVWEITDQGREYLR